MKLTGFWSILFAWVALVTFAAASNWSPLDQEILSLHYSLPGNISNFYELISLPKSASLNDITKSYRKLSRELHPDKVSKHVKSKNLNKRQATKFLKDANDRFAKLGLAVNILKNTESRERYDFFMDKGFPQWRGTDYFYKRYRPGFITVIIFLIIGISLAQLGLLRLTANRQRKYMHNIITDARLAAWRNHSVDDLNKKYDNSVSSFEGVDDFVSKVKTVILESGKSFNVHPNGKVFLVESGGAEHFLDLEEVHMPSIMDTIFCKLVYKLFFQKSQAQLEVIEAQHRAEEKKLQEEKRDDKIRQSIKQGKAAPVRKVGGRRRN
ncbi:hypothetical protein NADFUDRAFT_46561 [Nadsonia fulvescens var. elongata DSM 6958]|uniref:J domain-containing protein n=1 Tax=Nadsonia fulvescens var. elongata DSM 6958 TaxID=857566 RepID=A0A1E3PKP7_9ASCO|nr:hypothetical protein NADFUDRAFT_46561 [Nadsonia fulvescens var. elongata DSM 6958]